MKKSFFLLLGLVGLLSMTSIVQVWAAKPVYALNQEDVPGWWIEDEDEILGWNYTSYSLTTWYQIWINNQTWADANACMIIFLIEFPGNVDLNQEIQGWSLWELLVLALNPDNYTVSEKDVDGLDHCLTWNDTQNWTVLANKNNVLIFAYGYDSQGPPGEIFVKAMKDPTVSEVDETDLIELIAAQADKFPSGIPGFNSIPIVISVVVLMGLIILLKKDQLSLIRTA